MLEMLQLNNHSNANIPTQNINIVPDLSRNIDNFDGESGPDVAERWLRGLMNTSRLHNWPQEYLFEIARSRLGGAARYWYQSCSEDITNWVTFEQMFRRRFLFRKSLSELWKSMRDRMQTSKENISLYFHEKVALCKAVHLQFEEIKEQVAIGLISRELSAHILARFHLNEDELFQDILQFERVVQSRRNRFENKYSSGYRMPQISDTRVKSGLYRSKIGTEENKTPSPDQKATDAQNSTIKCFNCGEEGHFSKTCKKPKQMKCFKCGDIGHFAKMCPQTQLVVNDTKHTAPVTKYLKTVKLGDTTLTAMIDTGSSACTITSTAALKGHFVIKPVVTELFGFGANNVVKSYGLVTTSVEIDDVRADNITFRVVPDTAQAIDILIGRTFTELPYISYYKIDDTFSFRTRDELLHMLPDYPSIEPRMSVECINETVVAPATINFIEVAVGEQVLHPPIVNFKPYVQEISRGHVLERGIFEISEKRKILKSNPEPVLVNELECGDGVTGEQKSELLDIFDRYRDCVAKNIFEVGKTDLMEMEIREKPGSKPVQCKPYRTSVPDRIKIQNIVREWKDAGIVEESNSPYASPVLLVTKKNGDPRLVVDYRRLNQQTERISFPLPSLDECYEILHGSRIFITLDLAHGYLQLPLDTQSKEKTSFITPDETGQFTRAIFGLMNAPYYFSKLMQQVLGPIRNKMVIFYLDDMLIPANSWQQLMERLEYVLRLLRDAHLTLRLSKCKFGMTSVEFLGMIISAQGVQPGPHKLLAIKDFPRPTNIHTVRRFIGMASFFRRFVHGFSSIVEPITRLMKKTTETFMWQQEQEDSFIRIKELLTKAPVLQLFNSKAVVTELHTDASAKGLAAILLQMGDDQRLHPVYAISRRTSDTEKSYHSGKLELLAIIWAVERLRVYLMGVHFTIQTDCKALTYLNMNKTKNAQAIRWYNTLSEYDFDIKYRPGDRMRHVDALSRDIPDRNVAETQDVDPIEDKLEVFTVMTREEEVGLFQYTDEKLKTKIDILKRAAKDRTRVEQSEVTDYSLNDGILFKDVDVRGTKKTLFVIPNCMRKSIVIKNHDMSGHFGTDKTVTKILQYYFFPKMRPYVKQHVASCVECILSKNKSGKQDGYLNPIPPGSRPFEIVHMDHLGPFITSSSGNQYVLIMIDNLTKFVRLYPVRNTKSSTTMKKAQEYINTYGAPLRFITDRGTCYTAKTFQEFCEFNGISHTKNSSRHPQANGMVERVNQTLIPIMQIETDENMSKWDKQLPHIERNLNSTVNKTTGEEPFKAVYGYVPRFKDGLTRQVTSKCESYTSPEEVQVNMRQRIAREQQKYKEYFDRKKMEGPKYNLGDIVYVKTKPVATGESTKLQRRYKGPFVISQVLPSDTYGITKLLSDKNEIQRTTAHVSDLKIWRKPEEKEDEDEQKSDDEEKLEKLETQQQKEDEDEQKSDDEEKEDGLKTQQKKEDEDKRNEEDHSQNENIGERPKRVRRKPTRFEGYL